MVKCIVIVPAVSQSSALFLQERHVYEKVGESTEVALKVLAEKLNVHNLNRDNLTGKQLATMCCNSVKNQYNKVISYCVRLIGCFAHLQVHYTRPVAHYTACMCSVACIDSIAHFIYCK